MDSAPTFDLYLDGRQVTLGDILKNTNGSEYGKQWTSQPGRFGQFKENSVPLSQLDDTDLWFKARPTADGRLEKTLSLRSSQHWLSHKWDSQVVASKTADPIMSSVVCPQIELRNDNMPGPISAAQTQFQLSVIGSISGPSFSETESYFGSIPIGTISHLSTEIDMDTPVKLRKLKPDSTIYGTIYFTKDKSQRFFIDDVQNSAAQTSAVIVFVQTDKDAMTGTPMANEGENMNLLAHLFS